MSLIMHRRFFRAALVAVLLAASGPVQSRAQERSAAAASVETNDILLQIDRATVALFARVSPSVVQIITFDKGKTSTDSKINTGSGFFWDKDGHIVTNAHVVDDAEAIVVWLASGQQLDASVVGSAPNFDLAVLKIKGMTVQPVPVAVGSSTDLKVGQSAFAIGSPFGLDQTLTAGVISSVKRQLPTSKGRSIANIIQTDAAITRGSSGGPLLDALGRLIGVNTIAYSNAELGTSFGFAIPVETVKRIVPQLIRDGRIATPGIGIVPAKEEIALKAGIEGVIIARVRPDTPAAQASLRPMDASGNPGDIIIGANGQPIENIYDLTDQLEQIGAGGEVTLKIQRDGKVIEVTVAIIDIDAKS
jgi:2-alkenal reductase